MVNITPTTLLGIGSLFWVLTILLVVELVFKGKRAQRFLYILIWQTLIISIIISLAIIFWLLGGQSGY